MEKNNHQPEHNEKTDMETKENHQPETEVQKQPPESETVSEDIEAIKAERDELLEKLKRVSADYLNYQKRITKEIAQAKRLANADLIKNLLTVLDDMERALDHASDDPLSEGMKMVYKKALDILSGYGLKQMETIGKPFDPERHEAMTTEPVESYDGPVVLKELQKGYEFQGRVLRPARVVISAPIKTDEETHQADEEQSDTTQEASKPQELQEPQEPQE